MFKQEFWIHKFSQKNKYIMIMNVVFKHKKFIIQIKQIKKIIKLKLSNNYRRMRYQTSKNYYLIFREIEHQDPLPHTHNFENKIYEKVLRKHSLDVKPENQDKND